MNAQPSAAPFSITIDGHTATVQRGQTVLDAARTLGIDIPTLCYLEKCGPLNTCQVCLVKIGGKLVPSCATKAEPGMRVESETNDVHEARRTALELLFSDHVGDCLAPCHRLCPLGLEIPLLLRQIQAGNVEAAAGTIRKALPLPSVLGRLCHHPCEQGCRRGSWDDPAAIRDLERFVADWANDPNAAGSGSHPRILVPQPPTGKSVAIIGSGPTGLAAAYFLSREGHRCVVMDRQPVPGGTLSHPSAQKAVPPAVLENEIRIFENLGVEFRFETQLGRDIRLPDLLQEFDAVLLAPGEISKTEGETLGLEMAPGGIKVRGDSHLTGRAGVFAAGRALRPITHLVRAMSDGQAAAREIASFLLHGSVQLAAKEVSSVMGRLDKTELQVFLSGSSAAASITPCDACAGFNRTEAAAESARCLHCDCRSSGNCALQSLAQRYGVDANRFRQERRRFEQFIQPGGVIFEPGKCILCGICVKLTALAREPLGLTFIGRGFEVRVGAPFNATIEAGLQKTAEECVRHCPTGALAFR